MLLMSTGKVRAGGVQLSRQRRVSMYSYVPMVKEKRGEVVHPGEAGARYPQSPSVGLGRRGPAHRQCPRSGRSHRYRPSAAVSHGNNEPTIP